MTEAWYRGAPWLWLLLPLEWLYRAVTAVRRMAFARRWLTVYRAPVPVIVVGNITVGGTGKTPVVIALLEAAQAAGLRAGLVSRGYGASEGPWPALVYASTPVARCGDEPLLIVQRTSAPCAVGADRPAAIRHLLEQHDLDLIISDDGLQHYAMARDFEIAVVDAARRLGNGRCLPVGPLREPAARLQQVDTVIYRGGSGHDGLLYQPEGLVNLHSNEQLAADPGALPAGQCAWVAGIGQPEQFFQLLESLGFSGERHGLPDHHAYSQADFTGMEDRIIIMTEKDAVKCRAIAPANSWYLKVSAQLPQLLTRRVLALATAGENT